MDSLLISQIAGTGVFGIKLAATALQARFPDSRRIRLIHIPATALATLSYAAMEASKGIMLYGASCLRSSIRATPFGAKRPKLIGTFMAAAVSGYTAMTYEEPSDILPMAAFIIGTTGDCSPQGRYTRLAFLTSFTLCATPYAVIKENWAMAITEAFAALITSHAVNKHDIKNAAGENQNFAQNLKAYLYGIFHNAVTGAAKKGQVSSDAGHAPIDVQYDDLMRRKPNPYFPQSMTIA